jgi:UDP-2,3-diacylglucosamine hydrolase
MGATLTFGAPPLPAPLTLQLADWPLPAGLSSVEFLSDLHLDPSRPRTLAVLADYLSHSTADAIVLLGDLFEVWVGDDAMAGPHEASCVALLHQAAQRRPMGCMVGNRDFLLGPAFHEAAGLVPLPDATLVALKGAPRVLLTHGDAWCLDDRSYLDFRAEVRSPAWQHAFLARPLSERQALARQMRAASEQRRHSCTPEAYGDVDAVAARQGLARAGATVLLHGHTHRPAQHELGSGLSRWVLSDWEFDGLEAPRGDVIRLDAGGLSRHRVRPDGRLQPAS